MMKRAIAIDSEWCALNLWRLKWRMETTRPDAGLLLSAEGARNRRSLSSSGKMAPHILVAKYSRN